MRMPRTISGCGASIRESVVLGARQSGVVGRRHVALSMSLSFESGAGRSM